MKQHALSLDSRQTQFGLRVGAVLSSGLPSMQGDISERLRFAREQAEQVAVRTRRQQSARATVATQGHQATLAMGTAGGNRLHGDQRGPDSGWTRAAAWLPLLLLLAGLWWVQQASLREQALAAASVDAVLLADTLPPQAYSDPGFAEYLRTGPP